MDCWTSRATFGPGFAAAFEFSGAGGGFFFTRGARVDSAVAVVANVRVVSYYYSGVIGVVNDVHVDVIDCGVVEEMAAVPTAAFVAVAEIAEAVVHACRD